MSDLNIQGTPLGNALQDLLMADDIVPGSDPSYQICKTIFLYHPLGLKLTETPITMAQSKPREIAIPDSPEEEVKEAFLEEWDAIDADAHIHNVAKTARIYGVASLGLMCEEVPNDKPIDYKKLPNLDIAFSVFDPLNTAGSLVLNQNPLALDFQKQAGIAVSGTPLHRSRSVVMMNERPIYIGYTNSAFGYVGRSVYQRILFLLKSYLRTMITDDLIALKAGVLIAKMKQPGSMVNNPMAYLMGLKRNVVKQAQTGNVINITPDEAIETIDMTNVSGAGEFARKNILNNIATGADMPAVIILNELLAHGFGEGSEDAKQIADYIDRIRRWINPAYRFMDRVVQHRAWTPQFYKGIQKRYAREYGNMPFNDAFYRWQNSYTAGWQNYLQEPESERVKVEETKFGTITNLLQILLPMCDPDNKAKLIEWAQDNLNSHKLLFPNPLELDTEVMAEFEPPLMQEGAGEGKGGGAAAMPKPRMASMAVHSDAMDKDRVREISKIVHAITQK